ncbi:MAG: putative molybdenum carrier protein [Bacteroidetes bacterium]|nr:putative molybdenum carrier protein [Bacteroidota bacterium]
MNSLKNIKIISGGQTGADRAALDFALKNNIPCGGWCPRGRLAEDGNIGARYPLVETTSTNYPDRTRKNIENSDGTVIFYLQQFDAGTGLTLHLCKKLNKPHLVIKLSMKPAPGLLGNWLNEQHIHTLNIAGPRESVEPGLYQAVINYLYQV